MFASTAIPIERIKPAVPANVNTTPVLRMYVMNKNAKHASMNDMNFSNPSSFAEITLTTRNVKMNRANNSDIPICN